VNDDYGITRTGILKDQEYEGSRIRIGSHGRDTDRRGVIDSTAEDAGNTPTTTLRKGLCMAQLTATDKWVPYDSGGSGGAETFAAVLGDEVNMLNGALDGVTVLDQHVGCLIQHGVLIGPRCIGLDDDARASEIGQKILFRGPNPS